MTPRLTNADYVKKNEMTDDKYESKTPTNEKTEKPLHIPHLLNSSHGKTPSTGSDFPIPNATPMGISSGSYVADPLDRRFPSRSSSEVENCNLSQG
jgi:hypothetical protein